MTLADTSHPFAALPLHDAVLSMLRLDWRQRTCVAEVSAFVDRQQSAVPCLLVWSGFREVRVPHHEPWGPSACIHATRFEVPDRFIVEMQSGDQITITAESFRFTAPPA